MNQCNNDSVVLISSRPRLQGALGAALGAVVAGLALTGGQAKAMTVTVPVTVSGISQKYDVTTFTGAYTDPLFTSKFTTTDMPWWGDDTLAKSFASAVGGSSGLDGNFGGVFGPFFAYAESGGSVGLAVFNPSTGVSGNTGLNKNTPWTFATATLAPSSSASVPGPLPILGIAAAFGFSRKLRKRIKSSTNSVPSSSAS